MCLIDKSIGVVSSRSKGKSIFDSSEVQPETHGISIVCLIDLVVVFRLI